MLNKKTLCYPSPQPPMFIFSYVFYEFNFENNFIIVAVIIAGLFSS